MLFHRRELRVTLVNDQVHQGVTYPLIGDVHQGGPFTLASVMTELDRFHVGVVKFDGELELPKFAALEADFVPPDREVIDPVVPIVQFTH